jgi:hypothetical protein
VGQWWWPAGRTCSVAMVSIIDEICSVPKHRPSALKASKIPWNIIIFRLPSSEMLRRVAPVRADLSEEHSASIIKVTRVGELGTTLTVTSNRRNLRKIHSMYHVCVHRLLVTVNVPSSQILVTWWLARYVSLKRQFLQEPHGVTSQKTAFFIVTAVKTSNLT